MNDIDLDAQFTKVVMEGLVPRVQDSALCVSLVPKDTKNFIDPKFCVELGVMVMLDKPILAIVDPAIEVPQKLRLVADVIVVADLSTEEGRAAVQDAVVNFADTINQSPEEDQ